MKTNEKPETKVSIITNEGTVETTTTVLKEVSEKIKKVEENKNKLYFTKIKTKDGEVLLNYSQWKDEDEIKSTFDNKKKDEPLESFTNALNSLREEVVSICELPRDWKCDLTVIGVNITYFSPEAGNKLKGFSVTALRTLTYSDSPMVLNTPNKLFSSDTEKEEAIAPYGSLEKIERIIEEAEAYLNGARSKKQLKLELEKEE